MDRPSTERHKFHPEATFKYKTSNEEADWETGYIKNIEHEFAGVAEDILVNIDLKHLLKKPGKKERSSK